MFDAQQSAPDTPATGSQHLKSLLVASGKHQAAGIVSATTWFAAMAAAPWVIGQAINSSLSPATASHTVWWCVGLLSLSVMQAISGGLRHYHANQCFYRGSFYTKSVVGQHATTIGARLNDAVDVGDVLSHSSWDARRLGILLDTIARAVGALLVVVTVVGWSLAMSWKLGLVMTVGVPTVMAAAALVNRTLYQPQREQREASNRMVSRAADGIAGLRVLQGFGGQTRFLNQYVDDSTRVCSSGRRVGRQQAFVDAAQVALIGALLVGVVWLGALEVLNGAMQVGDVVAFFGWTAMLATPLDDLARTYGTYMRARVALHKLDTFFGIPAAAGRERGGSSESLDVLGTAGPVDGQVLVDEVSGVVVEAGLVTGVVSGRQGEYRSVVRRLAHVPAVTGSRARLGGVLMDELPLGVARGVVGFSGSVPQLTAGSLRSQLDPGGQRVDEECLRGLWVVAGGDVVDEGRGGLGELLTERGRSLSGGQRQRVALARAVLSGRRVLVLEDPTSAVDSVTEDLIVERVCAERVGLSTVVAGCSPLWLAACDVVFFVCDGQVVASGGHEELLVGEFGGAYRRAVFGDNSAEIDTDIPYV